MQNVCNAQVFVGKTRLRYLKRSKGRCPDLRTNEDLPSEKPEEKYYIWNNYERNEHEDMLENKKCRFCIGK